jgi:hypothetical protein
MLKNGEIKLVLWAQTPPFNKKKIERKKTNYYPYILYNVMF